MSDDLSTIAESGLSYINILPVEWHPVSSEQDDILDRYLQSNESLLNAINDLEDHHAIESADEHSLVMQEVARLDRKLDLILDMLGRMLSQYQKIPPAVPVTLAIEQVQWETTEPPEQKMHVEIRIFISQEYPMPLVLSGCVTLVTQGSAGRSLVTVELDTLPDPLENNLNKLIFRHHRRSIATARKPTAE